MGVIEFSERECTIRGMKSVIFVAPVALEATQRFLRAAVRLHGARLSIIGQDGPERLSPEIARKLATYERIADCHDPAQLEQAVRAIQNRTGQPCQVLLAILEPIQVPVAQVRERLGIPGMSVESALNFRDKSRMKDVLRAADLPCARHRSCNSVNEVAQFAASTGFPIVVKPQAGAGAKNTHKVETREQLDSLLRSTPVTPQQPLYVEEFVQGDEFSFDSVSIAGRPVFHSISRYLPTPLHVLENPWIQWVVHLPLDISGPDYAAIHRAGPQALEALGVGTNLTHMEWFRRRDGSIAISEVAARPPGAQFTTLLSVAHGTDFYQAWVELMVHGTFAAPTRSASVGCAYLRGQGSGRIQRVLGMDQIVRELGPLLYERHLPEIGATPRDSYEGDGYIIVRGPDSKTVEQALARVVETVRVELA